MSWCVWVLIGVGVWIILGLLFALALGQVAGAADDLDERLHRELLP